MTEYVFRMEVPTGIDSSSSFQTVATFNVPIPSDTDDPLMTVDFFYGAGVNNNDQYWESYFQWDSESSPQYMKYGDGRRGGDSSNSDWAVPVRGMWIEPIKKGNHTLTFHVKKGDGNLGLVIRTVYVRVRIWGI